MQTGQTGEVGKKYAFLKSKERQEGVGRNGEARVLISTTSAWAMQNKDWGSGDLAGVGAAAMSESHAGVEQGFCKMRTDM